MPLCDQFHLKYSTNFFPSPPVTVRGVTERCLGLCVGIFSNQFQSPTTCQPVREYTFCQMVTKWSLGLCGPKQVNLCFLKINSSIFTENQEILSRPEELQHGNIIRLFELALFHHFVLRTETAIVISHKQVQIRCICHPAILQNKENYNNTTTIRGITRFLSLEKVAALNCQDLT